MGNQNWTMTVGTFFYQSVDTWVSLELLFVKSVHGFRVKDGWELNVEIGIILVDIYAKCEYMNSACLVFDLMHERNLMTWTTMMRRAAQNGLS